MSAPAGADALIACARRGNTWLFQHALPLWWTRGYDTHARAFYEAIAPDGAPRRIARRVRVQARQTIVYARAGLWGWNGPWREAVVAGLEVLQRATRADGALYHTLDAQGEPLDLRCDLYDAAFALLAYAEAARALQKPDPLLRADAVLRWLDGMAHPLGGYREGEVAPSPPRRQNPHMHLFEALLALCEASGEPGYRARAAELARLAQTRLFDANRSCIPEYFADDWTPLAEGQTVEPGHQFEWSWLLRRWRALGGDGSAEIAEALRVHGERHGVNPLTGAVYDATDAEGRPRARTSRLWTNTERLKAHLAACADAPEAIPAALQAFATLERYFDTPQTGLWRDRMQQDGAFAEEDAPASSFYHIVLALFELARVTGQLDYGT